MHDVELYLENESEAGEPLTHAESTALIYLAHPSPASQCRC